MMSLWDALRMNMMISYQELVRTFPKAVISNEQLSVLGATETYINEVSGVKLKIIVSQ
ncbi:type 1 fimbrial protein [Klebsiella variicola CAG:634]|nr:type 1 fimbrial protein [Klebsiella variicola CAG:634]